MHVFADETKDRGYMVAAAVLPSGDVSAARRGVTGLLRPGQRRLHFTKERDSRRRQIIDAMCGLGGWVGIYDAARHGKDHHSARKACIDQLAGDCVRLGAQVLVIERDDSLMVHDRRWLYERMHMSGAAGTLRYQHQRAYEEPLLAIPDAVAWCWAKGGEWRKRAEPLVKQVHQV